MRILYFGAEHCPMCKMLRPKVEDWCKKNNVEFEYRDADDDQNLIALEEHHIKSIPSAVVIDGDKGLTIRGIDGWNEFAKTFDGCSQQG